MRIKHVSKADMGCGISALEQIIDKEKFGKLTVHHEFQLRRNEY